MVIVYHAFMIVSSSVLQKGRFILSKLSVAKVEGDFP